MEENKSKILYNIIRNSTKMEIVLEDIIEKGNKTYYKIRCPQCGQSDTIYNVSRIRTISNLTCAHCYHVLEVKIVEKGE